jgi:hypothetical protein
MCPSSSSARAVRRGTGRSVLLAVSSRKKLGERFGRKGLDRIEAALDSYKESLAKRRVTLEVAFLDDSSSMVMHGVKPAGRITSVSAKNAIDRLLAKLKKPSRGRVSLLILGGGEVIPYFRLSNPALDSDGFVPSDNPYGCKPKAVSADDCLLPERPVGRMPDGNGRSVELLLRQIESASTPSVSAVSASGASKSAGAAPASSPSEPASSLTGALGYTAAVWKKASQRIWDDLGYEGRLRLSPPLSYADVKASWFKRKSPLYFNLHGSDREPYWFGQKGTKFTTALSPANVKRFGRPGSLVLTEACYGAIEMKRQAESSMALAFLSTGSLCVTGSTCVAYGAIIPPLSEADLIALHFLRNAGKGMALGEALVNARAQMAAAAVSKQGYLDEDDRKTLLQFVLFGDPTQSVRSRSAGK